MFPLAGCCSGSSRVGAKRSKAKEIKGLSMLSGLVRSSHTVPVAAAQMGAPPLLCPGSRGFWKGRSPLCLPSSGAGGFSSCSLSFSLQQSQAASHLQTFLDTHQTCNSRVHGSSPPKRSPSPSLSIWRWQKRHQDTAVLHLADSSLRRTLHPSEHTPKFPCFSRINERALV